MIDSNLAVLFAERNLKITKVSRDTGISRTTLTSLCYDYSGGIKFDTLNILCKYLGVTPAEFFSYSQYDYEIEWLGRADLEETILVQKNFGSYEFLANIIIYRGNQTWKYPLRALMVDYAEEPGPFKEGALIITPDIFESNDDLTDMDRATIREFRKMESEMTQRQIAALKDALGQFASDSFVVEYADDHDIDPDDVLSEGAELKVTVDLSERE